jgi:hypothetical protein
LPKNLADAVSEMSGVPGVSGSDEPPEPTDVSLDHYELVQQGGLRDFKNPVSTILVRERPEFALHLPDGGIQRCYGFADGHSEIHRFDSTDFASWEQEHLSK